MGPKFRETIGGLHEQEFPATHKAQRKHFITKVMLLDIVGYPFKRLNAVAFSGLVGI